MEKTIFRICLQLFELHSDGWYSLVVTGARWWWLGLAECMQLPVQSRSLRHFVRYLSGSADVKPPASRSREGCLAKRHRVTTLLVVRETLYYLHRRVIWSKHLRMADHGDYLVRSCQSMYVQLGPNLRTISVIVAISAWH